MRVLLVDDEPLTLESLEQYLPWGALGIDTVETASNGMEGLEIVRHVRPQIIISDVRMPRMNGIEFATKVRDIHPNAKLIFLSGYSDKEYLKSAIHLKAVRYVEKPVKLDELTAAIQESIAQYESEQSTRHVTRSYVEQRWLTRFIKENKSYEDLRQEELPEPRLHFLAATVLPIAIRISAKREAAADAQPESTEEVVQWLMERYGEQSLTGYGEAFTLLLLIEANSLQPDVHVEAAESLLQALDQAFGQFFEFTIGLGPNAFRGEGIGAACRQAIEASGLSFYRGSGKVLSSVSQPSMKAASIPDETKFRDFRAALRQEQELEALAILERVTAEIRQAMDRDHKRVVNMYFRFLMTLHDFAVDKGLSVTDADQEERFIWQEIVDLATLDALYEYVGANLAAVFSQLKEKSTVGMRVSEVMAYIQVHYAEKGLTTRQIAENTYLSHTYLCALFKKETGKTLGEYMTEVRIAKARELLQDPRMKLYEVSLSIGITDPNYFSSLFKKATGMTPSQYRERM